MNMIQWIQNWYKNNCNGEWEHCYGIRIATLDNPGWLVDIDLTDTDWEDRNFEKIQLYIDDNNWIHCSVVNGIFRGRGGADKLEEILKVFSEWVTANNR